MKPFSAFYYIKENKKKSFIIKFMLLLTTFIFLAGNYIDSVYYFWNTYLDYSDDICLVNALSTDEDFKDFASFYQDLEEDEKLIVLPRTGIGHMGLSWKCTIGFEMGTASMVFNSVEDMKKAFDHLGIKGDFTDLKDNSVVISETLAKQYGLKKGDIIDASVDSHIDGKYTLDAIIDDGSFVLFYVIPTDEPLVMANVMSTDMSGKELRDYIRSIQGDRKANIDQPFRDEIDSQFAPFLLIFFSGIILLSIVLSIVINSVITGQYIRRTYEFGVYRAIGISRFEIIKKCCSEILTMDVFAIIIGVLGIALFSFLINELYYIPGGKYLPYYSSLGLGGFLLSNLMVIIPTMLLKGGKMSKADVTEF